MGSELNFDTHRLISFTVYNRNEHDSNTANVLNRVDYIKRVVRKRIPILSWVGSYTFGIFLQDLLAGFTVGLTEIPQAIAYAIVAGLPSQYGLYSGFMGCFTYFFLGTCKDINMGPTALMALMIQRYVTIMGPAGGLLITFLTGCAILLCGLMRLGFIVDFFSYPVTSGFTTAAALNIAASQIKSILGISGKSDTFLNALMSAFHHIKETSKWDLILGLTTIVFLIFAKELRRFGSLKSRPEWSRRRNIVGFCIFMFSLASNAIAVITGTSLAFIFAQNGYTPFKLTGNVEGGLPSFDLPPFSTTWNGTFYSFFDILDVYGTTTIFCPMVALLEHIAIAKAFSKGKSLDATQELLALGFANLMGSFVMSMPVTGSFTRTAVNNASGAKTPTCGIITGLMVLLALAFLTTTFKYIPKAVLAGVIMVAMYYLCDFQAFKILWRSKKLDLLPLVVTIVCCLLISLEVGIILGITTNVTFVLYASARPKVEVEEPFGNVYTVKLKSGVHFTAAEYLKEFIMEKCSRPKCFIIIDGKYVGKIDATVAKSLNSLIEECCLRDQTLIFCNFKESVIKNCLGINKNMAASFRNESFEQIIEDILQPTVTVHE